MYAFSVSLSEKEAHWQTRKGICGQIQNLVIRETTESVTMVSLEQKGLAEAIMAAFTYPKD